MKYAIIVIGGKQYKVEEKKEIFVDKITGDLVYRVLMVKDGDKLEVGTPELDASVVKLTLSEEEVKGDKLTVYKYKSKSRYRRKQGFRPIYSKIKVDKIG